MDWTIRRDMKNHSSQRLPKASEIISTMIV
uniref:Uncharacterized protein n=1 Tax=Siphoviridae sp. ctnpt50 TaxID=2827941 RepID=A0A8S5SDQ2_9CAUD|nr:MAG TPA: hypothetical protein [Siphoviridae sp. ctnpt50]